MPLKASISNPVPSPSLPTPPPPHPPHSHLARERQGSLECAGFLLWVSGYPEFPVKEMLPLTPQLCMVSGSLCSEGRVSFLRALLFCGGTVPQHLQTRGAPAWTGQPPSWRNQPGMRFILHWVNSVQIWETVQHG